jgi:hypothetical protein
VARPGRRACLRFRHLRGRRRGDLGSDLMMTSRSRCARRGRYIRRLGPGVHRRSCWHGRPRLSGSLRPGCPWRREPQARRGRYRPTATHAGRLAGRRHDPASRGRHEPSRARPGNSGRRSQALVGLGRSRCSPDGCIAARASRYSRICGAGLPDRRGHPGRRGCRWHCGCPAGRGPGSTRAGDARRANNRLASAGTGHVKASAFTRHLSGGTRHRSPSRVGTRRLLFFRNVGALEAFSFRFATDPVGLRFFHARGVAGYTDAHCQAQL